MKSKSLLSPVSSVNYGASSVFLSFTDFSLSHVYVGDSLCVCDCGVPGGQRLGIPLELESQAVAQHEGCDPSSGPLEEQHVLLTILPPF